MNPLDLVKAAPWNGVLFTTYSLSLSFFEAVVVDALIRGGARNPTILSDPEGVRAGLSERGARLVGRDYELLPVERVGGVFHPKLSVFLKDDDAHILVGSGNLTFGGWGGNFELVEHLHPSFASEAIVDAADFLELLSIDERIRLPSTDSLGKAAESLRRAAQGQAGSGRIRLVHNAGGTIAERLQQEAYELGGAERICIVSPFFDTNGIGVTRLSELLNCDDVSGYVHFAGSVKGFAGGNWPALDEGVLTPVEIDKDFADDHRLMHAKAIEVLCRDGRLVLSGSVNTTSAALFGANMEAGLLSIEPNRHGAWSLSQCSAPARFAIEEDDLSADDERTQILAAELVGTNVQGRVLTSWPSGPAKMNCEIEGEFVDLGSVEVEKNGTFSKLAEQLADRIWSSGRIVIRLETGEAVAEGFLMITAVAALVRRAGQAASRILSVLAGTETPEDVAAIMAWFHEDPSRMPRAMFQAKGQGGDGREVVDEIVTAGMLDRAHFLELEHSDSGGRSTGWESAMSALLRAFRTNRGPFRVEAMPSDDTGESLSEEATRDLTRDEKENEKAIDSFSKLLDTALTSDNHGRYAETMLGIAHYLVDRIRPPDDRVAIWLDKILRSLPEVLEGDLAEDILALELLRVAHSANEDAALKARRLLSRKELLAGLATANAERLPAFHAYLPPAIDFEKARAMLASIRTHREQIQMLLDTPADQELPELPLLEGSEYWPELRRLHNAPDARARVEFVDQPVTACPKCHTGLPTGNSQELLQVGFTRCANRCRRLIISREP